MTLQQVYTLMQQINEKYNLILNNAKTIEEFDEQLTILASAYIPMSSGGVTKKLNIQTILAAIVQTYIDRLIYVDEITIVDNDVTVPAGVQALISNITYFTTTDFTVEIPFADTGKSRIDIIVIDNTSTLSVITGIETLGVAVRPNIPLNSVLVTQINVTDSAFTTVDGLLYKGEFDSLEELNTLHPSALSGSYAIVSTLSSSTVYYWSAINGWFTNAGGGEEGQSLADVLLIAGRNNGVFDVPDSDYIFERASDVNAFIVSKQNNNFVLNAGEFLTGDELLFSLYDLSATASVLVKPQANVFINGATADLVLKKGETASLCLYEVDGDDEYWIYRVIGTSVGGGSSYTDATFGAFANGLTGKSTPIDADLLNITDTADSNKQKKLSFTNLKAFLKTYFDTLYTNASAVGTQITTALSGYATQSYADGKVQNDLTPSTTVAPSATAVNTALALSTRILVKDVVPSVGVNSTPNEIILKSYPLLSNTMSAEDILNIVSMRFKSNGLGGSISYKYYIAQSAGTPGSAISTVASAVLIGGVFQSTAANVTTKISNKTYTIYGGNIEGVFSVLPASSVDSGSSSTALGSTAFDHTIDNHLIVAALLGTSNTNNARLVECLITH